MFVGVRRLAGEGLPEVLEPGANAGVVNGVTDPSDNAADEVGVHEEVDEDGAIYERDQWFT